MKKLLYPVNLAHIFDDAGEFFQHPGSHKVDEFQ